MRNSAPRPPDGARPLTGAKKLGAAAVLCIAVVLTSAAFGKEAAPAAVDPVIEARMTRITSELRCLVCQNQTIADSNADLAQDLRRQVREMLHRGSSDEQIVSYMTDRYGDFVLYRPPLKLTTLLLWFGPLLMLVAGFATLVVVMRKRSRAAADRFEADDPALFADPHQS